MKSERIEAKYFEIFGEMLNTKFTTELKSGLKYIVKRNITRLILVIVVIKLSIE